MRGEGENVHFIVTGLEHTSKGLQPSGGRHLELIVTHVHSGLPVHLSLSGVISLTRETDT